MTFFVNMIKFLKIDFSDTNRISVQAFANMNSIIRFEAYKLLSESCK